MNNDIHPETETLERFAAGILSHAATERVERHVIRCRHCEALLEHLHNVPAALQAAGERYRQVTFQGNALATVQAHRARERRWTHYVRAALLIPAAACIGFLVLQLLSPERSWMDRPTQDESGGLARLRFARPLVPSSMSFSFALPPIQALSTSPQLPISFTIPSKPSGRMSAPERRLKESHKSERAKGVFS